MIFYARATREPPKALVGRAQLKHPLEKNVERRKGYKEAARNGLDCHIYCTALLSRRRLRAASTSQNKSIVMSGPIL
jgi:hypothetical protein